MNSSDSKLTNPFWREVEVVDAVEPIRIFPQKRDLEKAIPGDSEHCVLAQCLKRVLKVRRVRIWRNVALVESKNEQGQTIVLRYLISKPGKHAITSFDQGVGTISPCTLLAPSPGKTLEAMRKKAESTDPEVKRMRRLKHKIRKAAGHPINKHAPLDLLVRCGSGIQRYAE